jgi:leucyl-tRNA synthetase
MQRNWIGRSEGLDVDFTVAASEGVAATAANSGELLRVFTTRPDTLMGVTYMAVAAEHPVATRAAQNNPELAAFIAECRRGGVSEATLETQPKRGMPTGLFAVHPVSNEQVPIWVANFVLMGYGTGAVMAVPGHDERDFEFAHRYGLPIKQVIEIADEQYDLEVWKPWYADKTHPEMRVVNSGIIDGMNYEDAFDGVAAVLLGRSARRVNYRLRDWGVSRQRYWGCPIPMVHCANCGDVPVPEAQLPVLLPEDVAEVFSKAGGVQSPIKSDPAWRKTTCPACGAAAERETFGAD